MHHFITIPINRNAEFENLKINNILAHAQKRDNNKKGRKRLDKMTQKNLNN